MHAKSIYKLLAIVVALAMLAACAPAAQPTTAPPAATEAPANTAAAPAAPAASGQLPPIVVAVWSGPEHDNAVKLAAAYTAKTGNKVTIEEIARESYQDKLNTTFVGGGSDYDAAYISSDWPPAWIKANALKDLDQFFNDP